MRRIQRLLIPAVLCATGACGTEGKRRIVSRWRRIRLSPVAFAIALAAPSATSAQTFDPPAVQVPLSQETWTSFGDTLRFGSLWGRESLYLHKGVAFANDVELRNGTIEFEIAAPGQTLFLGVVFRAQSNDAYEMVFFRPGGSGTSEAIQYQASLMGSGTWQLFHGPANGTAALPRDRWIPVRVVVAGPSATIYVDGDTVPALTIPDLALGEAAGTLGFWTGSFGNGGYLSNLRYQTDDGSYDPAPIQEMAEGTIVEWELSESFEAPQVPPGSLPTFADHDWETVRAEPWKLRGNGAPGIVWVNRYRRSPDVGPSGTVASIMAGGVPGSRVVFAKTTLESEDDAHRLLHFGYTDGLEIYLNGEPLFLGMNPLGLRALRGVMERGGEAIYLPLTAGSNEIVFAVTEYFGGWAFWARLDP